MKQLLPMCTAEELNTKYEDAGERVWHLVPDQTKKPWAARSLCGIRPSDGRWAGVGLLPTCQLCIDKQNAGETRDAKPYKKHVPEKKGLKAFSVKRERSESFQ